MTWSTDEIHDIISGLANIILVLAIILFSIYFLAPLFGGKFSISALLFYGSWTVIALCAKYEAKIIKARKIGGRKFILVNIFESLWILLWFSLWFSFPYNLAVAVLVAVLFLLVKFVGYKALLKQTAS
jgi:hypothetical protein